jgi:hypothetical protein
MPSLLPSALRFPLSQLQITATDFEEIRLAPHLLQLVGEIGRFLPKRLTLTATCLHTRQFGFQIASSRLKILNLLLQ